MIPPMTVEGAMVGLLTARDQGRIAAAIAERERKLDAEFGAPEELLRSSAALHRAAEGRLEAAAAVLGRVGLDVVG